MNVPAIPAEAFQGGYQNGEERLRRCIAAILCSGKILLFEENKKKMLNRTKTKHWKDKYGNKTSN